MFFHKTFIIFIKNIKYLKKLKARTTECPRKKSPHINITFDKKHLAKQDHRFDLLKLQHITNVLIGKV